MYNQLPTGLFKFSRLRSRTTLATDDILQTSVYCTLKCQSWLVLQENLTSSNTKYPISTNPLTSKVVGSNNICTTKSRYL